MNASTLADIGGGGSGECTHRSIFFIFHASFEVLHGRTQLDPNKQFSTPPSF
jgi:hypothetical protein